MSCVHLKKLYSLCEEEGMKISSGDLVRIVCTQCGEQEVCPTILVDQYETLHGEDERDQSQPSDSSDAASR